MAYVCYRYSASVVGVFKHISSNVSLVNTIKMEAVETVRKYLRDQNRPYNAIDIATNLHKEFGKAVIQKALDKLVDLDEVIVKVYGKQKIYGIKQSGDSSLENLNQKLKDLDAEEQKISAELQLVEKDLSKCQKSLKELKSEPVTEEIRTEIKLLASKIEVLNAKWENIIENPVKISAKEKDDIVKEHDKYVREWRKRKSTCMLMIDTILENYPKTKAEFLEEVGIETDEAVKVCIPN
ncbi:homologous-pairing protein 2 homolog [Bacillus rossius redtenbacheri]|uniref:homologous-pairing protein 2 homolog n=1 Tax=Bacillus rossius redtenbacheri TaxID=93214 RepID=UPI002FDD663E